MTKYAAHVGRFSTNRLFLRIIAYVYAVRLVKDLLVQIFFLQFIFPGFLTVQMR